MKRRQPTRRACLAALGAAALTMPTLVRAQSAMEKLRERGRISIAVYNDIPPFNVDGAGIDIELANALADAMQLKLTLLPFNADEGMNDDLRNMVWKGHYLGYGPADLMLHVPVDRPLMQANPQVEIFAPYFRESVAIARQLSALPQLDSFAALAGHRVAVPGQSLAGWLLIGADDGAYRGQLITQWKDGAEAARALLRGEFDAAAGNRSELESVLGQDPRFAIDALPSPRAPRSGWAVGCAVKSGSTDLARAVQTAMNGLIDSGAMAKIFAQGRLVWRKA